MAENYCGVRVAQNYKYKFVCEHCRKEVTKDSFASVYILAGGSRKATTTFSISSAGYKALVSQGRKQFAQLNKPVQEMFDNHNYKTQKAISLDNFDFANQSGGHIEGLNDECMFCKKIQHWHDFSASGLAVCIISSLMVAAVSFFVLWFILNMFKALSNPQMVAAIVALLLFVATFIWLILDEKKIKRQQKELEHLEKTYPVFVGWGTEWNEPRNMKVNG